MAERPFVLLSAAMSADGYIDDAGPDRLILSDAADLERVDQLRAGSDAILIGAGTIRADNPRLLVRSAGRRQDRFNQGLPASPLKVTVTSSGELDPQALFFTQADSPPLVYAADRVAGVMARRLGDAAHVVPFAGLPRAEPEWIVADLAARGVGRLMVEGGASILAQFLAAGLADEFSLAIAPVLVADPAAPRLLAGGHLSGRMELVSVTRAGDMAVLRFRPGRAARA
jgi:5-amino-6-(5-phosphoribosylamino)uracil reductase